MLSADPAGVATRPRACRQRVSILSALAAAPAGQKGCIMSSATLRVVRRQFEEAAVRFPGFHCRLIHVAQDVDKNPNGVPWLDDLIDSAAQDCQGWDYSYGNRAGCPVRRVLMPKSPAAEKEFSRRSCKIWKRPAQCSWRTTISSG